MSKFNNFVETDIKAVPVSEITRLVMDPEMESFIYKLKPFIKDLIIHYPTRAAIMYPKLVPIVSPLKKEDLNNQKALLNNLRIFEYKFWFDAIVSDKELIALLSKKEIFAGTFYCVYSYLEHAVRIYSYSELMNLCPGYVDENAVFMAWFLKDLYADVSKAELKCYRSLNDFNDIRDYLKKAFHNSCKTEDCPPEFQKWIDLGNMEKVKDEGLFPCLSNYTIKK